ncbi:MAG: hypothetical protein AAF696_32605 [Bacteroidota bacterium]
MFSSLLLKNKRSQNSQVVIPLWVNIMQIVLCLIMLTQVYMYFFDHEMMADSGISVEGNPMLNLVFEMGARTLVMALVSIYVLITQNPQQFLLILLMNIIREGQETIIDPLFPVLNAPASPMADFWIHAFIVALEIWALITVLKKIRQGKES